MRRGRKQLALKRTGVRSKRRTARPTIGSSLVEANRRAHQKANQRLWKRRGLKSMEAAIAGTGYAPAATVGLGSRVIRVLFSLLLLGPLGITCLTLVQRVTDAHFAAHFWKTDAFIYFAIGFVLHGGWFFTRLFQNVFLYLYVLGHELTHAMFVYVCLGRVSGFRVSLDGGHVVTNKSNFLIALSPYFVPLWSMVSLGIASIIFHYYPTPWQDRVLFVVLGATWSFHILWTIWILPRDQPDLDEHGPVLSYIIILLANVILLSGLLCLTPMLTWRDFVYNWVNNGLELVGGLYRWLESLLPMV